MFKKLLYAFVLSVAFLGRNAAADPILAPGGGQIYALLAGIDEYATVRRLKGAVADARDLASSLKKAGVPADRLRVLLNGEVTRARLLDEMKKIEANARKGDLVILSFAGHGARIKELYPGTKEDGRDEAYVLTYFNRTVPDKANELLVAPEIKHWIGLLDAKGVDIIFIADTCHGGGLTRNLHRPDQVSFRGGKDVLDAMPEASALANTYSTRADALRAQNSFTHLTFLGATTAEFKTPEVRIDGQATLRGALSYAFARTVETAWSVGGGEISRDKLFNKVNRVVRAHSQAQQIFIKPDDRDGLQQLAFRSMDPKTVQTEGDAVAMDLKLSAPLRIAVEDGDPGALAGAEKRVYPFELVTDRKNADIVWNAGSRQVFYQGSSVALNVSAGNVPNVVDRIGAGLILQRLAEKRTQTFDLRPNDNVHYEGETIKFHAEDLEGKFFIAFNIAGDGKVQHLFPQPWDKAQGSNAELFHSNIQVRPPFGSDQVVLIVSTERMTELEAALQQLDGSYSAGAIPDTVARYLDREGKVRIGLISIVTAPKNY